MACDHDEVRFADLVNPIKNEFPKQLDAFCDFALSLQRYLFNLTRIVLILRPVLDSIGSIVRKPNRCSCWLAQNGAYQRSGKVAMDALKNQISNEIESNHHQSGVLTIAKALLICGGFGTISTCLGPNCGPKCRSRVICCITPGLTTV